FDGDVSPVSEDWVIACELDADATKPCVLRASVRQLVYPPVSQGSRMPSDDAARNDRTVRCDGHDLALIAAPHKPSDSFPRPVPELNRSVVSKAFQSVRDIDVCTGHPDSREQPVEELPRLADERNALLVL